MADKLTLEKAKELSDKKWTLIFNNDGKVPDNLLEVMPELNSMKILCSMCEYQWQTFNSYYCNMCIYAKLCGPQFQYWKRYETKENAFAVVTEIRKLNKTK